MAYNEKLAKVVVIEGLTEAQAIALEDMLATWVSLGSMGASRWTSFFADGDGNFRPRITIDGRKPQFTELIPNEKKWPKGSHNEYRIDFDWIAWALHK
jgi:hypothetical protein